MGIRMGLPSRAMLWWTALHQYHTSACGPPLTTPSRLPLS